MSPSPTHPLADDEQGLDLALGSPAPFYMTGEDNLRVQSLNSAPGVQLTLSGRLFGRGNRIVPFSIPHVPNTNRTIASALSSIGEGWIMGLQVVRNRRGAADRPMLGARGYRARVHGRDDRCRRARQRVCHRAPAARVARFAARKAHWTARAAFDRSRAQTPR